MGEAFSQIMSYEALDDLTAVGNPHLETSEAFTVCALVRNEMYFLPAFLDHYRALGVGRFVLLNDRSTDGSREFLLQQPDVMLIESQYRYGDKFYFGEFETPKNRRMIHVWKTLLLRKYCCGSWAASVDLDEFILLPTGWSLEEVTNLVAGPTGSIAIAGVMLDLYPATIGDLLEPIEFKTDSGWYFDARQHLSYDNNACRFRVHYHGARSRLMQTFGITLKQTGWRNQIRRFLGHRSTPKPATLFKSILLNGTEDDHFIGSHVTTHRVVSELLLPILHYKFTHDLFRRIAAAMESGEYFKGSQEYRLMHSLLTKMQRQRASFRCVHSKRVTGFATLVESGNALLKGWP